MAKSQFLIDAGVEHPIICGPMYPCSNPELVAAVSSSGGLGVIQPISLTYVHGYDFREGLAYIQSLTSKPLGMNLLIEKSSKKYHDKMLEWLDIALDMGVRFFITSLGKPDWVVEKVHQYGGIVYHDVTETKWAEKAIAAGVDGLIAVNNRAGGHAGQQPCNHLLQQLQAFNLPVVCAGGIATRAAYQDALSSGYQAVQMGTRFIASEECSASMPYKLAIIKAQEKDIVLTERMTGVPVSVINTPYIQRQGLTPNRLERWMLAHRKFKHLIRTILALKSLKSLKDSLADEKGRHDYWQAGKSAGDISSVITVQQIIDELTDNTDT